MAGCLALDEVLASRPRHEVFLEDGHWAAGGYRIAAGAIAAYLRALPGFGDGRSKPPVPVIGQDGPRSCGQSLRSAKPLVGATGMVRAWTLIARTELTRGRL